MFLFPLLQFLLGCNQVQNTTTVVALIAEANRNPTKAIEICSKIEKKTTQNECLFSSSLQIKGQPKQTEKICKKLEDKWKNECFFNLAEATNEVEYCQQSGSFEIDCKLHLLSQRSIRYHSMKSLVEEAKALELDLNHPNVESILYRTVLSRQKRVPISQCSDAPNQNSCLRVGAMIYQDILNIAQREGNFPCAQPLGRLEHQNQETLLGMYNKIKDKLCAPEDPNNNSNTNKS